VATADKQDSATIAVLVVVSLGATLLLLYGLEFSNARKVFRTHPSLIAYAWPIGLISLVLIGYSSYRLRTTLHERLISILVCAFAGFVGACGVIAASRVKEVGLAMAMDLREAFFGAFLLMWWVGGAIHAGIFGLLFTLFGRRRLKEARWQAKT
jgi:hypothetical protein